MVHSRGTVHYDSSDEEEEEIMENGGICLGISVKWLEQIIVHGNAPNDSWPDIGQSLALQLFYEEEVPGDDYFPHAGMKCVGRNDFFYYNQAMSYMWENSGEYLVVLTGHDEQGGHAYAFSKYIGSEFGHLFDPNEGIYVAHSCDGLIACFWQTGCAYSWNEENCKIILFEGGREREGDGSEEHNNGDEEEDEESDDDEDDFHEDTNEEDDGDYDVGGLYDDDFHDENEEGDTEYDDNENDNDDEEDDEDTVGDTEDDDNT